MSSSNLSRRPGLFPTHRKRHLDPGLDNNQKRRGADRSMNARFDGMIETMSDTHSRSGSPRYTPRKTEKRIRGSHSLMDDAYSLPTPVHLENRLSFVKMDAATLSSPDLSDPSAQVSVSRRRSSNSLPDWLANTFMTLSKKHPLRLLLPYDLTQTLPGQLRSSAGTSGTSGFMDVPPDESQNDPEKLTSYARGTVDANFAFYSDISESLPYSTPGPDSVASKSALSAAALQTSSSPTLLSSMESHLLEHKQLHQSIDHASRLPLDDCDGLQVAKRKFDPTPLPLAENPYVLQIYATPGPTYRPPAFQSEDSRSLECAATSNRSDNDIDFHWWPFDRKRLVASVISKTPAFSERSSTKTFFDNASIINADRPSLAYMQSPDGGRLEALSPGSPSPFSFSPLDIHESAESAIYPESHELPKTGPLQTLPGGTSGSLFLAESGIVSKDKELPDGDEYGIGEAELLAFSIPSGWWNG